MRLIFKLVGVLAIALIAVQPVTAGCTPGTFSACAPGCPMNQAAMGSMSSMGPDCRMMSGGQPSNCSQDCCSQTVAQAVLQMAAPERPKVGQTTFIRGRTVSGFGVANTFAFTAEFAIPAPSLPRYVLNQVFRI